MCVRRHTRAVYHSVQSLLSPPPAAFGGDCVGGLKDLCRALSGPCFYLIHFWRELSARLFRPPLSAQQQRRASLSNARICTQKKTHMHTQQPEIKPDWAVRECSFIIFYECAEVRACLHAKWKRKKQNKTRIWQARRAAQVNKKRILRL